VDSKLITCNLTIGQMKNRAYVVPHANYPLAKAKLGPSWISCVP
jgi:hypothetical protein